jgi:peptidoglycan/LPS O-acetylase OafA/YrhL
MRYLPEVDGLRAFAVIPVILFHMEVGAIPGGFAGVDVFFVISGFLITSIILKELQEGKFSFKQFWARRIRRILPAMLLVVASILVVSYFFGFRGDCSAIAKSAMAAILSYANIFYMRGQSDYWGPEAHQSPLLHTWSLSVEEQFYLFFPLAVSLIYRFFPRRLQTLFLGGIILSLLLFLYGVTVKPIWTFYLLPARAWELGTGCYVATIFPRLQLSEPRSRWSSILGVVGLVLVVASYFLVTELGSGLILAVSGASLVIAFARSGPSYWILSRPLVVFIGKIS